MFECVCVCVSVCVFESVSVWVSVCVHVYGLQGSFLTADVPDTLQQVNCLHLMRLWNY